MNKLKIVAGGGVVVNEKKEVLMIYRRGYWDLPKGKLDDGETIEQCALREVMEETGLSDVQLKKLICKTHHDYFDKWIGKEVIKETWWYAMQATSNQLLTPQSEEDIEIIKWVEEEILGAYLSQTYPSVTQVMDAYKQLDI